MNKRGLLVEIVIVAVILILISMSSGVFLSPPENEEDKFTDNLKIALAIALFVLVVYMIWKKIIKPDNTN